jgi:hypothetical protein
MSRENVELVRSIHAAWEGGDYGSADWAHPDIEYVIADGPTPGSWFGLTGMADGVRSFLNVWEDWRFAWEGYLELGAIESLSSRATRDVERRADST